VEDDHADAPHGVTPNADAEMSVSSVASAFMHAYTYNLTCMRFSLIRDCAGSSTLLVQCRTLLQLVQPT